LIDEDVAAKVLDHAESIASPLLVEVRMEETDTRHVAVKSGKLNNISSFSDAGMYVRVSLPSGIGFASTNRVTKADGLDLVKKAVRLAKGGRRKAPLKLAPAKAVESSWEVRQAVPLEDIGPEEKMAFLNDVDKAVQDTGVKVQGRFFQVMDYVIHGHYANSEGTRIGSVLPRVVMNCFNLVVSKGESDQVYREWAHSGGWEQLRDKDVPTLLANEIVAVRNMIDKGRAVKPGRYDLVCGPEVAGIAAHESCGHPMEGDRILGREMSQAGKTFVNPGMIGERIGSPYATVIDDPTVPGSYGYYAFDHEGVRARPRLLYKEGVINEFLHNRETAGAMGVETNASSRSESYLKEPIVRMANTFVAPGDYEDDEIFGDIRDGVLMKSFTEWNIDDKRFNQKYVSREAYFIKDGEIADPARKCILEITTPGFWGAIDATSKNVAYDAAECGKGDPMQGMAVFVGGPHLRLRGVVLK
jgi:TldD protein